MPRKPQGTDTPPAEDQQTAAKRTPRAKKAAPPDEVKVVQGRLVKKPGKNTPAKKPVSAEKLAEKAGPDQPKKPATKPRAKAKPKVLANPAKLSQKQQKALEAGALRDLEPKQALFVDLWLVSSNATRAYIEAGYRVKNDQVAAAAASRLLTKVKDHPYTKAKRAALVADTTEVQNRVLGAILDAALADPRELVEYRYYCCRHCHGKDFKFQFTPHGMRERRQAYALLVLECQEDKKEPPPFDEEGGVGYHKFNPPHASCPECFGVGIGRLIIKDTANLSPAAVRLFGGVEEGKEGLKVRVNDQKPYLEMLARLYNMNVDPPAPPPAQGLSKEELNEIYSAARDETARQRAGMEERARQIAELAARNGGEGS